jgi:hypothetical protein
LKELSDEQLNTIPKGFSNNIIWNLGHMMVSQQLLCYKLSGLDCGISDTLIDRYKTGSRPNDITTHNEVESIKTNFLTLAENLKHDYSDKKFKVYATYTTRIKTTLNSIDDAIVFNTYHEGIHLGIILQLLKLV